MHDLGIILLATLVIGYSLVSRRLAQSPVTGPMVFVAFGLLVGTAGLDLIDLGAAGGSILLLLETTLALVLFTDAFSVSRLDWREDTVIPGRLLGIGLPLTMLGGWLLAWLLLPGITVLEAAVIGVMLAPTDAALGQGVVSNPRVPVRIRRALNVESGLNDGLALPVFFILLDAAAVAEEGLPVADLISDIVVQTGLAVAVGGGVGLAGALLLGAAYRRQTVDHTWARILVLGLALLSWAGADALGASGFIAAWVAGFSAGRIERSGIPELTSFGEETGYLLTLASFVMFGALALGPALAQVQWTLWVYALLSLTLVRMLPVAAALGGARLGRPTVLYLGWFGPRGLASIILGLVVVQEAALAGQTTILLVVTATVGLSVLLHGATAWWGSNAYADWYERTSAMAPMPEAMEVSSPVPSRRMRHA